MDKPQELVIATFNDKDTAAAALKALKKWSKSVDTQVLKSALLKKDEKGKTSVDQDQDVSVGEGTLFGAVVGAVIGLLGGPGGVVVGAAAGAATGGVTAAAVNLGFSDDDIKTIRASLPANSSAVIALVEERWVSEATMELKRHTARVWHQPLPEHYREGVPMP